MHGEDLLQDLAVIMIVAGLVTVVFHRLRQPVVLGYILAGFIVGPHTRSLRFIQNTDRIQSLAEIGMVFLMFSLGQHFSLRKLARVGPTAVIAATFEIVLMVLLGYLTGRMFGWSPMDSLFLGAILSISSTTIIVKALADLGRAKERFAELIFGILIVEDILAIAMIAFLSSIAVTGSLAVGKVAATLLRLTIFLAVVLTAGLLAVPPLLRYVARFKSNEMMLIATLGLCFGVSLLAVKLGYSVALGAFLIGAIVAEVREAGRIETLVEGVRDMFSAVFFVAVGMLIDPALIAPYWLPTVVITVVVVVGQVTACSIGTFLAGHDMRTSLRVGMGLAQIGEFSFIIAQLGQDLNVTSRFLYPIAVTVSAVTTLVTPYLIRSADPLIAALERSGSWPLLSYLEGYGQWLGRLRDGRRGDHQVRKLLRKWTLQVALNVALLSGIFIGGAWLGHRAENVPFPAVPRWTGGPKAIVWLAAMLLALPLLVATFRKVRAAAMVVAEASISRAAGGAQTRALRAVMANTVVLAVSTAVVLWVLLLSSTVLPPWPVLIALAALIVIVIVVGWNRLVRVYAKAQIALRETLTAEHAPAVSAAAAAIVAAPVATPLPAMLRDAVLETVPLPTASVAVGKLIRELQLRTLTGASIVGIERNGSSVINPGPDDELLAGDRVLLLGTGAQIAAARGVLGGNAA